jgi:hypothetical protein
LFKSAAAVTTETFKELHVSMMNTRLKKLLNERVSIKKETSPSSQDQQREQRLTINNHYQLPVANRYSSKERMLYKPEDALVFTYVKEIGTFKVPIT